jgi:hypothetical protein
MSRFLKAAAAQMGPNPEGTPRDVVVERMLALLEQAIVEPSRGGPDGRSPCGRAAPPGSTGGSRAPERPSGELA